MNDTPPKRSWLLNPGWLALLAVLTLVGAMGLSVCLPHYRQQQLIHRFVRLGGKVLAENGGPQWLRTLIGDQRMTPFDQVRHVGLVGTAVTDADLQNLYVLKDLQSLD